MQCRTYGTLARRRRRRRRRCCYSSQNQKTEPSKEPRPWPQAVRDDAMPIQSGPILKWANSPNMRYIANGPFQLQRSTSVRVAGIKDTLSLVPVLIAQNRMASTTTQIPNQISKNSFYSTLPLSLSFYPGSVLVSHTTGLRTRRIPNRRRTNHEH